MQNKAYTLALLQTIALCGQSISLAHPDSVTPQSITINGDVHGNIIVSGDGTVDLDGDSNLDNEAGGYIHVTGITHLYTDHEEFEEVDMLLHVDGLPDGAGIDNDGNEGCDYARVLEEEGVHDVLYDWFEDNQPANVCIDDEFIMWMLNLPDPHCVSIQRWMIGNLERTQLNFEQLGEDVNNNRQWMHSDVLNALFTDWMTCFPNFDDDREALSPDEVNADFIRSLIPLGGEGADKSCLVDEFGGRTPDYPLLMEEVNLKDVLYNWFQDDDQINVCINEPSFLIYLINNGDLHCHLVHDWMVTVLEENNFNFEQLGADIENDRAWMTQQPMEALHRHWTDCFPDFVDQASTMPDEDVNAAFIESLVPISLI